MKTCCWSRRRCSVSESRWQPRAPKPLMVMKDKSSKRSDAKYSESLRVGMEVDVKWEEAWWPAKIKEKKQPMGGGDTKVLVVFEDGEQEWIEAHTDRIRARRAAKSGAESVYDQAERSTSNRTLSDGEFWKAAGAKASDFNKDQADLLSELLESRVKGGAEVLEVGSGGKSFVPSERISSLHGIGLVREHLQGNPALTRFSVLDLNAEHAAFPLNEETFDVVVCSGLLPYLQFPLQVFAEAARVLRPGGSFILSWTSRSQFPDKQVLGWANRTSTERTAMVKEMLAQAGFSPESVRLDVSGPTTGSKLYLVSACTPAREVEGKAEIRDAVTAQELLFTLKDKSKKRQDAKRQKEQDDKPFRVKVVSPPPERMLEGVYFFHPRTHNGDKVSVEGADYTVSKVQFVYVYSGGRYRLEEKVLEVQRSTRFDVNEKLRSLLPEA